MKDADEKRRKIANKGWIYIIAHFEIGQKEKRRKDYADLKSQKAEGDEEITQRHTYIYTYSRQGPPLFLKTTRSVRIGAMSEVARQNSPARSVSTPELREYEKILDIHKQVLAGTHPRLNIAIQPNGNVASLSQPLSHSQNLQSLNNNAQTVAPKESKNAAKRRRKAEQQLLRQQRQQEEEKQQQQQQHQQQQDYKQETQAVTGGEYANNEIQSLQAPATENAPALKISTAPVTSTTSTTAPPDIDPIFLTESPVLVRAKIQLQRDRLERLIHEQVVQRKADRNAKAPCHESSQNFQVEQVLERAHGVVVPYPALSPSSTSQGMEEEEQAQGQEVQGADQKEAGDEMEVEMEGGEPKEGQPYGYSVPADAPAEVSSNWQDYHTAHAPEAGQTADLRARSPVAEDRDKMTASAARQNMNRSSHMSPPMHQQGQGATHVEEPEYSPPEPNLPVDDDSYEPELEPAYQSGIPPQPPHSRSHEFYRRPSQDVRAQLTEGRHGARYQHAQPHAPLHVQNQIVSPVAPRPERVSPLTTGQYEEVQESEQAASRSTTAMASSLRDDRKSHGRTQATRSGAVRGVWPSEIAYTPEDPMLMIEPTSGPRPKLRTRPAPLATVEQYQRETGHPLRKRRRLLQQGDSEHGPMSSSRPSPAPSHVYIKTEPTSPQQVFSRDASAEAESRSMLPYRAPREAPAYIDITDSPRSPNPPAHAPASAPAPPAGRPVLEHEELAYADELYGHAHPLEPLPLRRIIGSHRAPSRHVSLHPEDSGVTPYSRSGSVAMGYVREPRPRYRYVVEDPDRDGYVYADAPLPPPPHHSSARYRESPAYREAYYELEHPHERAIPYPPARKIVVDQDGNRYLVAPPHPAPSAHYARAYPYPAPPTSRRREVYIDEEGIERVPARATRYEDAGSSAMPPPYPPGYRPRARELLRTPPSRAVSVRMESHHPPLASSSASRRHHLLPTISTAHGSSRYVNAHTHPEDVYSPSVGVAGGSSGNLGVRYPGARSYHVPTRPPSSARYDIGSSVRAPSVFLEDVQRHPPPSAGAGAGAGGAPLPIQGRVSPQYWDEESVPIEGARRYHR